MDTQELFLDDGLHIVDSKLGTIATMTYATVESEKQAQLFITAPKLLVALKAFVDFALVIPKTNFTESEADNLQKLVDDAVDVIAKANGEKQLVEPIITVTKTHTIDIDNLALNCNIVLGNEVFDLPLQYNVTTNWVHEYLPEETVEKLQNLGVDILDILTKIEERKIQIK